MILLDTSIVIAYLRGRSPAIKGLMATGELSICSVTRAEVLHGAKDDLHRQRMLDWLDECPVTPIPEVTWGVLGDNLARLRIAGLQIPFPDVLIATVGILSNLPVWSFDAHFPLIQPHLPGLVLFDGPAL